MVMSQRELREEAQHVVEVDNEDDSMDDVEAYVVDVEMDDVEEEGTYMVMEPDPILPLDVAPVAHFVAEDMVGGIHLFVAEEDMADGEDDDRTVEVDGE